MNKFTFDGSWNQMKGKLRQKFGQLTDQDLEFAEGKGEELFGRLQTKLGLSEDALNDTLNEMKSSISSASWNVSGKFEQVKTRAAGIADEVRAKAGEMVDEVKASASLRGQELKEQAAEVYDHAKTRALSMTDEATDYIRQEPRKALFGALAAGFLLGLLIRK